MSQADNNERPAGGEESLEELATRLKAAFRQRHQEQKATAPQSLEELATRLKAAAREKHQQWKAAAAQRQAPMASEAVAFDQKGDLSPAMSLEGNQAWPFKPQDGPFPWSKD